MVNFYTRQAVRKRLLEAADEEYKRFHVSLVPSQREVLGVRMPVLRKFAREIAKADWRAYLREADDATYEETLLQGLVIGCAAMPLEERFSRITSYVPKIDGWAICDYFCSTLKAANRFRKEFWDYLQPFFTSSEEFTVRFGVVMLLSYYITEDGTDAVLRQLDQIQHEGYYAKMAVAWAVSIVYIKFPEKGLAFLHNNRLDDFTFRKSLQKIRDSGRVSREDKASLLRMKRITFPSAENQTVPAPR